MKRSFQAGPAVEHTKRKGILSAIIAFTIWGFMPLFWRLLHSVSPVEILAQRIVWSLVLLFLILLFWGRLGRAFLIFRQKKIIIPLCCSSLLLGGNWLLYIWAVNTNQVLATSLGYYINPLLNILAGWLFFHEPISRAACFAIFLAFSGVLFQILSVGKIPLVALGLGGSFAVYGVLRKIIFVETIAGLFVETLTLFPLAVGYLLFSAYSGQNAFLSADKSVHYLLLSLGLVTTIPLLCFTFAARSIPLITLGILQYLGPSIVFILGIFVFDESLLVSDIVTFICIWLALLIYSWDSAKKLR